MAVAYELYVDLDGEQTVVEECTKDKPFRFVTGTGFTFDAFEAQLLPLAAGDSFDFVIKATEANGARDEEYVFDVDKNIFCVDGEFPHDEVYPGNIVPLLDTDGNRLQATVVAVKRDKVTIDLNHPLAGETLHFVGKVVDVRDVTPGELKALHQRGCGGCHGSCEDCESDCNSGCGSCKKG